MRVLKKNLFFVIIAIGMVICFINRWQPLETVVAPADVTVWFDVQSKEACQVWSPDVKWIESIAIPYLADGNFQGNLNISFENNTTGQTLVSQNVSLECKDGEQGEIQVAFNHLSVEPTTQYVFRMQYDNVSEGNGIFLYCCEKYAGGEIGSEDMNIGISVHIDFVKYNLLFFCALILFVLFSFGVFYMLFWDKRFEETVGLGVLSIGFILYVFGLFGYLETGVHLVTVLALMSFVGAVYLYNKKDMTIMQLFCPSMVILVVIFGVLMLYNRGIWYERYDEYSHWGTAVKDMFYFNAMSRHPLTTVKSSDYPPYATLLEYYFTYWNGLFSEPITYVGYQISMVSMLAVCWKTRKKYSSYLIPLVVATILVPVMFINYTFCTIYADSILGASMAYLLVCWIQEDRSGFNIFRISLGLVALTLTKRFGLCFALVFIGVLICDNILEKRKIVQWLPIAWFMEVIVLSYITFARYSGLDESVGRLEWRNIADITVVLALQVIGVLIWFQWKRKKANENILRNSSISATIKGGKLVKWLFIGLCPVVIIFILLATFLRSGSTPGVLYQSFRSIEFDRQQIQVCMQFFIDLWTENTWIFGWYGASYMGVVLVSLFVCIIVWAFLKHQKYSSHIDLLKKSGLLTIGALGYGAIVFVSRIELYYLFNGARQDYHDKYLASYGMVVILFVVVLLLQHIDAYDEKKEFVSDKRFSEVCRVILSLVICGFIIGSTPLNSFIIKNTGFGYNSEFMQPYDDIEKMAQSTAKTGDMIYYVTNNSMEGGVHVFQETVSPWLRVSAFSKDGMCASEAIYMEYLDKHPEALPGNMLYKTEEEFAQELRDYRYFFILKSEDYFIESYHNLFEDPDSIETGSFYKVKYDETGKVYLELIGKVGVLIC